MSYFLAGADGFGVESLSLENSGVEYNFAMFDGILFDIMKPLFLIFLSRFFVLFLF